MVEKIIVSPESIRALGNIVVPKTGADFEEYNCTMEVSEDTVNGEDVTVYVLTPETTTINVVLSSNVSTVTAGSNVILSVTVTEDEVPVSGQSVSFKLGSTELGTSTTNSSGVATYTYTTTGSGSLNFSADYAGHSSNGVSVVVNKRGTSTSLSLGSASIVVGGSTTASATVTSSSSGVSGLTVTFKDGTTILGTATTNSSGVATYTLSGLSVGSHSITAVVTATDTYDTSTSSASTLTVLDHSYSLAFSQSSYPASSGSATLEMTLLDNSVPVSGATVSVTGSDSSSYSCITNSSGVGSVTVTDISAETTFTATYQGVSDTCTVTVGPSYLFYDSCASDNTSQYTKFYEIWGSGSSPNTVLSFDTDHYVLKNNASSFSTCCLPVTAGLDDWVLTAKIRAVSSSSDKGGGVGIAQDKEKGVGLFQPNSKTTKHLILYNPNQTGGNVASNVAVSNLTTNDYNTYELTKDGTSLTFKIYNSSDTQVFSKVVTITNSSYLTSAYPALSIAKSDSVYVKEIKLESL